MKYFCLNFVNKNISARYYRIQEKVPLKSDFKFENMQKYILKKISLYIRYWAKIYVKNQENGQYNSDFELELQKFIIVNQVLRKNLCGPTDFLMLASLKMFV